MTQSLKSNLASFVRERWVHYFLPGFVVMGLNRNDRVGALNRAWGHVFSNYIEGAYYEFGVYRGETFRASFEVYRIFQNWLRNQLVQEEAWRRKIAAGYANYSHHFYAFDTFSGLPENREGNLIFSSGNFACTLEEFLRLNRKMKTALQDRVRYFAGPFAQVAQKEPQTLSALQPAAIVNVDCDLYESTCDALKVVAPKLKQGSVLLIDDWNGFAASHGKGQRRATEEFLQRYSEFSFEPWFTYGFSGQAFLVHQERPRNSNGN